MKNDRDKEITVYRATKDGKVAGLAYEIYGSGYAGEIKLMLAWMPKARFSACAF